MKFRLDAVVIILSILFIYGLGLANRDVIHLGPYPQLVIIVVYFSLFSWYDQYRRKHLERNYILILALAAIYLGAALALLFSRTWNVVLLGGGAALLLSLAVMIPLRKQLYAWLDVRMGQPE